MRVILSKTIDEWYLETQRYSSFYYERYVQAYEDTVRFSVSDAKIYANISAQYHELSALLYHIKTFGKHFDKENCSACKTGNQKHITALKATFDKYGKWIAKLNQAKSN